MFFRILLRLLQSLRRILHSLDDTLVAGTTAEVTDDSSPNLFLAHVRVFTQQVVDRENHSRRAEAALQGVMLNKGLLDSVEGVMRSETLNGRDFCPVGIRRQDRA